MIINRGQLRSVAAPSPSAPGREAAPQADTGGEARLALLEQQVRDQAAQLARIKEALRRMLAVIAAGSQAAPQKPGQPLRPEVMPAAERRPAGKQKGIPLDEIRDAVYDDGSDDDESGQP